MSTGQRWADNTAPRRHADQLDAADLATLTSKEIEEARAAGRLHDLLHGTAPSQLQRKERERRAQEVARANLRHLIDGSK